jgi:nucleoside-diphosphate-sugar epimerase
VSRVLVTGARGFVGRGLVPALTRAGHTAVPAGRPGRAPADGVALELTADPPVAPDALAGLDAIVHLAGLAHAAPGRAAEARRVNTEGTRRLAEAAAAAGVPRFVYVSTAQVHGTTDPGRPIRADDPLRPVEPYADSKAAAERALAALARRPQAPAVAVVRPPLVYGPGAGGNVARLVRWAEAGRPLPGGCAANRRSFCARANLCDLLVRLVDAGDAPWAAYLVRDPEDVSTAGFYAGLCRALGRTPRLLPLPRGLGAGLLRAAGRPRTAEALFADFRLDDRATRAGLAWTPPVALAAGLRTLAAGEPG